MVWGGSGSKSEKEPKKNGIVEKKLTENGWEGFGMGGGERAALQMTFLELAKFQDWMRV